MNGFGSKEKDSKALLNQINSAFDNVKPLSSRLSDNKITQETFESWYLPDKFRSLSRDLYNSNPEEFHYLMSFALRAYLDLYRKDIETDVGLNLFLLSLGGFENENMLTRNRYRSLYNVFNNAQRQCICSFLLFLRKYELDDGHVSDTLIRYWCRKS